MKLNFVREKETYHSIKIKQSVTRIETSEAAEFLRPATYFYDLLIHKFILMMKKTLRRVTMLSALELHFSLNAFRQRKSSDKEHVIPLMKTSVERRRPQSGRR